MPWFSTEGRGDIKSIFYALAMWERIYSSFTNFNTKKRLERTKKAPGDSLFPSSTLEFPNFVNTTRAKFFFNFIQLVIFFQCFYFIFYFFNINCQCFLVLRRCSVGFQWLRATWIKTNWEPLIYTNKVSISGFIDNAFIPRYFAVCVTTINFFILSLKNTIF